MPEIEAGLLEALIDKAILNKFKNLHTQTPGIIVEFDSGTQLAKVQPAVKRIFRSDDGERVTLIPLDLAPLINVQVMFPGNANFFITIPIKTGDECLIEFCERSIDNWYDFGGTKEPSSYRTHNLSDAVCHVGIRSKNNSISTFNTTDLEIRDKEGNQKITLTDSGDINITTSGDVTVACADLNVTSSEAINVMSATTMDFTSPIINLNGIVNISGATSVLGPLSFSAGLSGLGGGSVDSITVGGIEVNSHDHVAGTPPGSTGVMK